MHNVQIFQQSFHSSANVTKGMKEMGLLVTKLPQKRRFLKMNVRSFYLKLLYIMSYKERARSHGSGRQCVFVWSYPRGSQLLSPRSKCFLVGRIFLLLDQKIFAWMKKLFCPFLLFHFLTKGKI